MQILDRYIGRAVGIGVFAVTLVIIALMFLITFAGEFDKIGRGSYTVWSALEYTLLKIPGLVYGIFPIVTLLGAIIGLGALANSHELTIIRGTGISVARIIVAIMKMAVVVMLFAFLLGEVVAPPAEQYAKLSRLKALSDQISFNTEYGLWARDGNTYIHVQRADNEGNLHQIQLYNFDDNRKLKQIITAGSASHNGETWVLKNIRLSDISDEKVTVSRPKHMTWKTLLDPELVQTVSVEPETLAVWKLKSYIQYLEDNGLETANYSLVLWNKMVMPLTIAVMVLLAVPYVFGSLRRTSIGQQILVGFLVGLCFFIINKLLGQVSIVYHFHPAMGATVPSLLVLALAVLLMRRTH